MSTSHIVIAFVVSAVLTNLTDWFFFGFLFHQKYLAYPEVWWRPRGGAGETQSHRLELAPQPLLHRRLHHRLRRLLHPRL